MLGAIFPATVVAGPKTDSLTQSDRSIAAPEISSGCDLWIATASQPNNFWMAGRQHSEAAPALRSNITADVVIIGGGYTGLSAAYHLKSADPSLDIVVLEAETTGFGASGRNAGFVIPLFGASVGLMKTLHGKRAVREAHAYMESAITALEETVREQRIDCDYERSGFLKVATSPAYVTRIQKEIEFFHSLGIDGVGWLDRQQTEARVRSRNFLGASFEPHCGLINPVKWADGLRRIALESGVRLYENTRVTEAPRQSGRYRVKTDSGSVDAHRIVYATNGYSHLLPRARLEADARLRLHHRDGEALQRAARRDRVGRPRRHRRRTQLHAFLPADARRALTRRRRSGARALCREHGQRFFTRSLGPSRELYRRQPFRRFAGSPSTIAGAARFP